MLRMLRMALPHLFLLFGLASLGLAQMGTSSISGQVTDASGAVLPGVDVTVRNVATGVERRVQTNTVGIYTVEPLPPGEYEIEASRQGFSTLIRRGIVLRIDQRARHDLEMAVGAVADTVEVVAAGEQFLKPVSSELGEVITGELTRELPLNARNVFQLIALNAGVTTTSASFFKNVGVDLAIGGQRPSTNAFLIEGMDNVEFMSQAPNNHLSPDAVREFSILTNAYSAEYGRSNAGVINVSMRSGTNDLHGTLFHFLRNDKLDANDWFSKSVGRDKPPFRFNQFGGTLGGPIARNRTFFFGSYQGTIVRTTNTSIHSVPPLAWREGDFSSLLAQGIQLFDPEDVVGMDGVFPIRAPFPDNIIPANRHNATTRALLDLYPAPNLPGNVLNFATSQSSATNHHDVGVKVDHSFDSNNSVSGRWNFLDSDITNQQPLGDILAGGALPFSKTRSQNIGTSYVRIFRPTVANDLRYGLLRRSIQNLPSGFGQDLNQQFGIPGISFNEETSGLAFINPVGYNVIGGQVFFPQIVTIDSHQIMNTLSVVRGRHTIKVGGDYRRRLLDLFQAGFPRGLFVFDPLMTAQIGAGGNTIASMLLGYYNFGQRDILDHFIEQSGHEFSAFVQDDIRVTPRLTVNVGLRYDLFTPHVEAQDRQANFDLATGRMLLAGQDGNSRALVDTDRNNFAPRLGFAYSLTGDGKTVLRGGYGIFYFAEQNALATLDRLAYNIPFYFLQTNLQFGLFTPTRFISEGLPAPPPPDPANPFGKVGYRVPNLRDSYVQSWNLNVQRQILENTILDVAYAGSRGVKLLGIRNPNQPPPGPVQVFPVSPAIGLLFTMESRGRSYYDALQVKVNRSWSSGLTFLGSYTWSKSIDNTVGYWPDAGISQLPQDSHNPDRERGLSDWDIRHRFVLSYNYALPFGQGRRYLATANPVVNAILGGWQTTGILSFQGGTPFTPLIGTNRANTAFSGGLRPNRVGSGTLDNPTPDRWFDTSAFVLPDLFTFGDSGRNILRGPGVNNFDFGLYKNFAIQERAQLQFRTEIFNLTNTPHFGLPNRFIDQPAGGRITTLTTPPRQIQFGLKLMF